MYSGKEATDLSNHLMAGLFRVSLLIGGAEQQQQVSSMMKGLGNLLFSTHS